VAVFGAAALLLAGGYFASQVAFFNGSAARYSQSIDSPAVQGLAMLILVACVAFAAMPQKEAQE
jgi:hypothetical protein